mmetsp:Transcript_16994/g.54606  ORF Transcript_16994/g.54606 Transcript_16994/m.54606 type:complete len:113 (+) Transcript_16994:52-390(+)
MAQGNFKLKKPQGLKKAKRGPRGDQQKLKKGNHVIAPRAHRTAERKDFEAQQRITKAIGKRIEQTIAARGSGDGAGLSVVKADGAAASTTSGALGKRKGAINDIKAKKKNLH